MIRFSVAISVASITLLPGAAAAATAPCSICDDNAFTEALLVRPMQWATKLGGWKLRTRLTDMVPTFDDVRRYKQVSMLTSGNDDSLVSLKVERIFSEKRRPIEQINLPSDRMKRSKATIGYTIRAMDDEHLGIAMSAGVERRRLGFAALRGKWVNNRTIGVSANWVHAEQWRLSTSYTIDQSQSPHTGIRRSIQLAAGAPPSAAEMRVALDYSPSFLLPDNFRVGIEAKSDHLAAVDAAALAMRDRNDRTLEMKLHMAF